MTDTCATPKKTAFDYRQQWSQEDTEGVFYLASVILSTPYSRGGQREERRDENNSGTHCGVWIKHVDARTHTHTHTRMLIQAHIFSLPPARFDETFTELFYVCLFLCLLEASNTQACHRDRWKEKELCFFSFVFLELSCSFYVFSQLRVSSVR